MSLRDAFGTSSKGCLRSVGKPPPPGSTQDRTRRASVPLLVPCPPEWEAAEILLCAPPDNRPSVGPGTFLFLAGRCRLTARQDDFGGLLDGAAGSEIVRDRNAECALAVIPDDHVGLRVAVDRTRPFDPQVHDVAAAGAGEPSGA